MTSPDAGSGGHFHFSQDINVALNEIDVALRSFSGKVAPAVNQLNESLAVGVTANVGGVEEFVNQLKVALENAAQTARTTGQEIRQSLATGLAGNPFGELEAQAQQAVEEIGAIFRRGLAQGLLRPKDFGTLQAGLSQVAGTFSAAGTVQSREGGRFSSNVAPDLSALDAKVGELSQQLEVAAATITKVTEANAAVAAAEERYAAAVQNNGRIATEQAEAVRQGTAQAEEARAATQASGNEVLAAQVALATAQRFQADAVEQQTNLMRATGLDLNAATEQLAAREIIASQLVAESYASSGNTQFRNSRVGPNGEPLGPLTIPLGSGTTFGRFDDTGANPVIYKTSPATPETETQAAQPSIGKLVDPLEDPAAYIATMRKLEQARAAQALQAEKSTSVEARLAIAEDLRVRELEGSVTRLGNTSRIFDQLTGQGFTLKDTIHGTEAVPLGQEGTRKLQADLVAAEAAKKVALSDEQLANAAIARANAEKDAARGSQLATERSRTTAGLPGGATALGNNYYQMANEDFVKLEGENARLVTSGNDLANAQAGLAERQRRLSTSVQRGIDEDQSHAATVLQGFKAGFTSRGFESDGDPRQSLSQSLTNLSATGGVLAKYALAGEGVKLAAESLSTLRTETVKYTEEVEHLNVFLDHLNQGLSDSQKSTIDLSQAQSVGLSVAVDLNSAIEIGTNALAAYQEEVRNGADANQIFSDSIKQAGVAAIVTGQQADVASKQLIAITESFGTGSQGQASAADAISIAQKNFGGDPAQIAQAVAAAAPLASEGGITQDQLANMVALINARSTQTGTQIASTIERLVSRSQNKQFLDALAANGIADTGNVVQELTQLSAAYNQMDRPAQQALQTQLGSSRALTGLIPLLRSFSEVNDAAAHAIDQQGLSQELANKHLDSFGGQMQQLGSLLKTLAVDVGTSGIFTPIGLALEALNPPLKVATQLLGAFEKIIGPAGRDIGGLVVDVLLAAKAYDLLATSGGARAVATGLAAKVGIQAGGTAATDAETASTAALTEVQGAALTATEANAVATEAWTTAVTAQTVARVALSEAMAGGLSEEAALAATEAQQTVAAEAATAAAEAQTVALRTVAASAAEAAAAMDALSVADAENAGAGAGNFLTRTVGRVSGGRFGVATGAAGGEAGAAGIGTLATAGLFAAGLAAVALGEKAYQLGGAMDEADKAISKISRGSVDELTASAERLATAQANVKHESGGILGSTVNFVESGFGFGTDPAAAKLKELKAQEDELKAQIADRNAAIPLGGTPATLPGGSADLTATLSRLADSGASADTVMKFLITTIDGLTGASQRAAAKAAPGSLVIQAGGVTGIEGSLLDTLKTVPTVSLTSRDANGLASALDKQHLKFAETGFTPDAPPTTSDATLVDPATTKGTAKFDITGLLTSAEQSKRFRDAIAGEFTSLGKTGKPGEILSPSDLVAIAHAGAKSLGLTGKLAALEPLFEAALLKQLQGETLKPLTAANVRKDPTLLANTVKGIISTADQRTSDASARGAGTAELLTIQQKNLADLTHAYDSIKGAGLSANQLAPLTQGLAVARKNLFDAFQARVQEIAKAAEAGLGSSKGDQAKKAAIEAQVARILTEANKTDPTYLSGSFTSLSGAQNTLTNATVASATAVQNAASSALKQAEADAAALNAEAALLEAAAAANLAFANTHQDTPEGTRAEFHGDRQGSQAGNLRGQGKSGVAAATAPAPKVGLNDPSAQPGIDAGGAAAKNAATGGDTAAQIAAAKYAASIFPGDKIGEASAALRTARANLAAQSRNTVAYYDALKQVHDAEVAYSNAVLDAQANSHLLALDRTNPLLVAREKLREAQAKLNTDARAGAPRDVLTADKIALGDARSQAEATAFSQRLSDAQINDELGRTSHAAYLQYLNNEHNRLTAIQHRTRQQQDELNQIDQALKAASDQLSGQFNIGDIKIPTIYEVRRAIATRSLAGPGDTGYQDNRVVTISINGGDTAKVRAELEAALGTTATSRITVAPRKS